MRSQRHVAGDAGIALIANAAREVASTVSMAVVWTRMTNMNVINCPRCSSHNSTGVLLVKQRDRLCPSKTGRTADQT